jgi:hypothetical protein
MLHDSAEGAMRVENQTVETLDLRFSVRRQGNPPVSLEQEATVNGSREP